MKKTRFVTRLMAVLAVSATPALAEEAGTTLHKPGVVLVEPSKGDMDESVPASGSFVCANYPWVFIANVPGGYVIGNCAPGWHLHRTIKSDPVAPDNVYFDGGYLFGDYNGCGWIRADRNSQVGTGSYTACASPSRNVVEFGSVFNCRPGECADGTAVTGTNCQLYANYRPWSSTPAPTNPIGGLQSGTFLWRYVTRDGRFVMVRDPDIATGSGNWGFVPRSCLPGVLPPKAGSALWYP